MFKSIVSQLSLHPSAQGRLARYYKERKSEDMIRLLGAICAILLTGLQIVIIIAPPDFSFASITGPGSDIFALLSKLPLIQDITSLTVVVFILLLAIFLYARNRQLLKEASLLQPKGNKR